MQVKVLTSKGPHRKDAGFTSNIAFSVIRRMVRALAKFIRRWLVQIICFGIPGARPVLSGMG